MARRLCLTLCVLLVTAVTTHAEAVRFARTPDISPDGKTVAFSYLGDIWLVDVTGGVARHLTMHDKHDYAPLFSPDGKWLAFSSNRHGSYDVFVVPVQGGRPTRLTFDSADDVAVNWSSDSKNILFNSGRHNEFPYRTEVYSVPVTGGRAKKLSVYEGRDAAYSPNGDQIAYVRGPGTWYRKGYRGSSNDDIWLCNPDGSNNRQFTKFNGQDTYPMWAPDRKHLYYVSEAQGMTANIVRQELPPDLNAPVTTPTEAITQHKDESVRRARLCANGQALVYECGPDIFVLDMKSKQNRKLAIEVFADDKTNPERVVTFTSGATEYSMSADEKFLALVVQGEIFLMPRTGSSKAKQLTHSPANDHGVAWAPDAKKILFLSDRNGHEDIYALEPDDPEHPELVKAHRFKVTQLTNTPEPEGGMTFTPDGKRVSFLRAGALWTMNPDGSDQKTLLKDGQIFDYEWSPDGKWLVYARSDNFFASELFVVPATGPTKEDPARNVTRFATYNGGVTWSRTGNKLAFISQRRGNTSGVFVLSLQKPAAPGATPVKDSSPFDWDEIHLRVKQPANMGVQECAISSDGSKVAFRGNQDGDDLWVASSDGGSVTRLTTGNTRPTQIQWSKSSPSTIYFRDGNGNLRTASAGGGLSQPGLPAASASTINFQARMTVRNEEVYAEMFEQAWRALNEDFYDPNFHGANWNRVREKYRPLVKHCLLKEDLYSLVSLMLGELNASHLGISGNLGTPEQATADLGLLFDHAFKGPGLKVTEILRGGPADKRGLNLKAGDVLLAIDGVPLDDKTDLSQLLNDKANDVVAVQVTSNPEDPKSKRKLELAAVSRQTVGPLMYERWVRKNYERVQELSKGQLGYIHIPSMDDTGLDRFLRSLYSDNFDKEGIVIDVRFNGGGYTHEQVLNYLGGKEHTFFHHRHGGAGLVLNRQDRRWTKPTALLINNRSFSDAEIFPHAFRSLGLGKLVGQSTGGFVIGTRNITLIDGSSFRTPRIGVSTNKGVNMEKEGVHPDVAVEVHPDQLAKGQDAQLERVVEVLLQDVAAWKKTRPPVAGDPIHGTPGSGPGLNPGPMPLNPMVQPKKE